MGAPTHPLIPFPSVLYEGQFLQAHPLASLCPHSSQVIPVPFCLLCVHVC